MRKTVKNPRVGQNVGQAKPRAPKNRVIQTEKLRNRMISELFWHAMRDSNPRPSGP